MTNPWSMTNFYPDKLLLPAPALAARLLDHLHDPSLDVLKLQRILGMSRSDLHRKLKAAAGMSATAYLRYLRLRRAAQLLLEQPDWCILCVAIEVGFNDHSYFTKRFREVFGVCPGDFRAHVGNLGHTS